MRRAVIVDDERLARRELRSLLSAHADVSVVGEAESLAVAEEVIRAAEADTVFLDIQLGAESGMDLCPRLEPGVQVIFVTAHDAYAIRAFELHAVDYLLKPVSPERLARSLERLTTAGPGGDKANEPLEYKDFLFLRVDRRMHFIKVRAIVAVTSEADLTALHLASGELLRVRRTMAEWEARLPASDFARVHRSALVNVNFVDRVEDWFHSGYRVYMRGGVGPIPMSRRHASSLQRARG